MYIIRILLNDEKVKQVWIAIPFIDVKIYGVQKSAGETFDDCCIIVDRI